MTIPQKKAQRNRILRLLPPTLLESTDTLDSVELAVKASLYENDKPMRHVYFPLSGVASVIASSPDSKGVEIATIGREGMVGLPAFLGSDRAMMTAFMQVPGEAVRMEVPAFRSLCAANREVNATLLRYTQAFITQVAQSSACNRMHPIEERCARWLLMTHDRVDSDDFPLTQEFLSQMLGVRRASVSLAASSLQEQGLIRYERGHMHVLDRKGLEQASCECYGIIEREYRRLVGTRGGR